MALAEKGETRSAALKEVIEQIVRELVDASMQALNKVPPESDAREELQDMKEELSAELEKEHVDIGKQIDESIRQEENPYGDQE